MKTTTIKTSLAFVVLALGALTTAAAQDFRWTGRLAAGKRVEIKGVNGDIHAVAATGTDVEVTAVKHARRSDPDEVEIKVVPSDDGVTICAVYPPCTRRAAAPGARTPASPAITGAPTPKTTTCRWISPCASRPTSSCTPTP